MHPRVVARWFVLAGLMLPAIAWEQGLSEPSAARGAGRPVLRVLSIGVSRYRDQVFLSYAVKDARAVARAFQDHAADLFARVEVRLLTDDQADRRALVAAFEELRQKAKPGDVTVIYYVGHAANDEPIGFYLAPGRYNDKFWRQTMLPGTDLRRAWEAIPGRVVVLLDTCYTGALWGSEEPKSTPSSPTHAEAIITATRTEEETKGSRFWPGDFTQALLQALAGAADGDADACVTLGELESHLTRRVEARRDGLQHLVSVVSPSLRELALARP